MMEIVGIQLVIVAVCLLFVLALWLLAMTAVLKWALPPLLVCFKAVQELLERDRQHTLARMDREIEKERIGNVRA